MRRRPLRDSGPPARGGKPPAEPVPIIELYPNPLPPVSPITRESTLADLQAGFASLTDDELLLARLWLVDEPLEDIRDAFDMSEKRVRALWRSMRGKVRFALLDEAERACEAPLSTPPLPSAETTQETGGTSPA